MSYLIGDLVARVEAEAFDKLFHFEIGGQLVRALPRVAPVVVVVVVVVVV